MKVLVRKTGGFAGLEDKREIDTAQLNADVAGSIEQFVESIGFYDFPPKMPCDTIGADLFHYEVTVIEDGRKHTVAFEDDNSPKCAPLRKLVAMIE